jgi:hypothetical protein
LVDNSVASSLEQVKAPDNVGFFVVQGEDGRLDGEKEMDVDGFSVGVMGTGKEDAQGVGMF